MIRVLIIAGIFSIGYAVEAQTQEKQSLTEFSNGMTNKYSTNGQEKSLGLKLSIKYPSSWKSIEGEHPHIVRKFAQQDKGALFAVLVNKLDNPFTESQNVDFFTAEGLRTIVPNNGDIISIDTNLKIEGLQAGSVDYSTSAVRMDRLFNSYIRSYLFIYKDYLVMIQFMVANKTNESNQSVLDRYNILKPLFYKIFNSIVIENLWE